MEHPSKRLILSSASSVSRLAKEKAEVAARADAAPVAEHVRKVTKPASLSSGMKKAGIALIAAPDPITGVPGVALLVSSYVLKKKEPASLGHLALETRKILREIQSLSL